MEDRPVEGWPQLAIVEHLVPDKEMRERCSKFPIFGSAPLACAQFNLQESRCDIWYSTRGPLRSFVLAHERRHCEGYNHAGEHHLDEALKAYRANQASR